MSKTLLAVAAAAVAVVATPAVARHHDHVTVYRVGYAFGPSYSYTDYSALPQPLVLVDRELVAVRQRDAPTVMTPHLHSN